MSKLNNTLKIVIAFSLALLLNGCSVFEGYKIPIQQGNIISSQHVNELKLGMNKHAVTKIMGEPVLASTFSDNNWTYVYSDRIGGKKVLAKRVDVKFVRGRVAKISKSLN